MSVWQRTKGGLEPLLTCDLVTFTQIEISGELTNDLATFLTSLIPDHRFGIRAFECLKRLNKGLLNNLYLVMDYITDSKELKSLRPLLIEMFGKKFPKYIHEYHIDLRENPEFVNK